MEIDVLFGNSNRSFQREYGHLNIQDLFLSNSKY
jgi:hypothetical protein